MQRRRRSRPVRVGELTIGGGAPVVVQEMTSTDTRDAAATVAEIHAVEAAGCEVIRVAVPDRAAALALPEIKRSIRIPLVADIHFDYRLALLALDAGVDKLRINPGNIGSRKRVEIVTRAAKERGTPIRIGVNAGSLSKEILAKYGRPSAEAMVESALEEIAMLEALDFHEIIISLKSSDVPTTIEAYALLAEKVDYPLHVGVTEAGTSMPAVVRNAIGVGVLLYRGIGDTIRMSYTASGPVERVRTAYSVLESLGLRKRPSLAR